ncbi:hypothetical protein T265_13454, partial [Opisthorchis viverrini]
MCSLQVSLAVAVVQLLDNTQSCCFAYFPAGQQLVTPIGSRHPSETFPSGADIYPTSPYGANLPMAFGGNQPTLRVTSPTGTSPMAPIYPGLYSHLTPLASADVGSPVSKLAAMGATPSAVSLNELFNSMRLTGSNYPTSELPQATDLSQMFSALSQHPAGFVNVSGYPIFSSPTGPPSVLTSIAAFMDSSQHPTVQATPGAPPQLSLVSIEPSPGATFSAGSAGDLHSTVTSYAPRLLQTSDSATHMSHLFGAQSVPVIARRPMDPSEITPTTTTTSDKRPSVRVPAPRGTFKQLPSSHAQAICLSSPPCSQFEFPSPTSSSSAPVPTTKVQHSASPDLITSSTSQSQLESPGSPKDASSSQSGSPFDGSRQSAVAASDGRSTDATATTSGSGSETTAVTATQPLTSKSNTGKRILNGRPSRPKSSEMFNQTNSRLQPPGETDTVTRLKRQSLWILVPAFHQSQTLPSVHRSVFQLFAVIVLLLHSLNVKGASTLFSILILNVFFSSSLHLAQCDCGFP